MTTNPSTQRPSFYDKLTVQARRYIDDLIARTTAAETAQRIAEELTLTQFNAERLKLRTDMYVSPGGYSVSRSTDVALPPRSELTFYPEEGNRTKTLTVRVSEGQLEVAGESRLQMTTTASNRVLIQVVPR